MKMIFTGAAHKRQAVLLEPQMMWFTTLHLRSSNIKMCSPASKPNLSLYMFHMAPVEIICLKEAF